MQKFDKEETLGAIENSVFHILYIPFWGANALMKLRKLSQAQISLCGDLSLIETKEDKKRRRRIKQKDIIQYAKTMHKIAEQALISPTYSEIMGIVKANKLSERAEKDLKKAKELLKNVSLTKERRELEEKIDQLEVWVNLILPEDFLSSIVCFTLGIDETDIKKVTDKILLESAILAKRGNDNPADHVKGFVFSEFNKNDFNIRAWQAFDKWVEENKQKAG